MNASKTLWMGNCEKWFDENHIKSLLAKISKESDKDVYSLYEAIILHLSNAWIASLIAVFSPAIIFLVSCFALRFENMKPKSATVIDTDPVIIAVIIVSLIPAFIPPHWFLLALLPSCVRSLSCQTRSPLR